ncbi:hypothetical protein Xcab_02750 [Xenorhabdus cabanillasii JM26]|nr:hypothetical protein Xcab_02750 [Xenorhabdus cabanillasii JM26]
MTDNQAFECNDERLLVKLPRQTQQHRNMVSQTGSGIELTKEPQPPLGERERKWPAAIINCRNDNLSSDQCVGKRLSQVC